MESQFTRIATASLIVATALLAGCATPSAPDFHGTWKPVNRYAATTTQIPLAKTYVFFATPIAAALTVQTKQEGLPRIDCAMLSGNTSRAFAVQTPVSLLELSRFMSIDTMSAIQTSITQNSVLATATQPPATAQTPSPMQPQAMTLRESLTNRKQSALF